MALDVTTEIVIDRPCADVAAYTRTTDRPFAMETTYTWTPEGDGRTRMALCNRGGPTGIARIADPLAAWGARPATRKDLAALKRTLESGQT
jgi:hypothetical protein